MFSNYEELQHHLDAECHLFMEERDTTYDTLKKGWARIVSSVSMPNQSSFPQKQTTYGIDVQYQATVEGWVLKRVNRQISLEVCKMKKSKIPKLCQNLDLDELFLEKML